jgi:hypothetical protein
MLAPFIGLHWYYDFVCLVLFDSLEYNYFFVSIQFNLLEPKMKYYIIAGETSGICMAPI